MPKISLKSHGNRKTMEIINKLTVSLQVRPFDFVRKADPAQVLNSLYKVNILRR